MPLPLMDRANEIARATHALSSGGSVVFTGRSGVGTTRLLEVIVEQTESASRPALRFNANVATASNPLSVFARIGQRVGDVVREVEEYKGSRGAIVAIDDAHHLDTLSLAALTSILGLGDISLVLTMQTGALRPSGIEDLLQLARAAVIVVHPLPKTSVVELIRRVDSDAIPQRSDSLANLVGGYPRLIAAMIGDDGKRSGDLSHVDTLHQMATDRHRTLPADFADALEVLSFGKPLPLAIFIAAVGDSVTDRLERHGYVDVVSEQVAPIHPLDGDLLAGASTATARRRSCRRLLDAAIRCGELDDIARVGQWQLGSGEVVIADVALAAADMALNAGDPALAERLALTIRSHAHLGREATRILGSSLALQQRHDEAEKVFSDLDIDEPGGASERALNLAFGLGRVPEAMGLLERASRSVSDASLRAKLDAELGVIAGIDGDFDAALRASVAAIHNTAVPPDVLASAYVSLTLAHSMLGRCREMSELVANGLAAASISRAEVPLAADQIGIMHALGLMAAGEVERALEVTQSGLSAGSRAIRASWLGTHAIGNGIRGALEEALESAEEGIETSAEIDPFQNRSQLLGIEGWCRAQTGSPIDAPAMEHLRSVSPQPRISVWVDRALVWNVALTGDHERAARLAADAGDDAVEGDHLVWGAMAYHDAVRLGCPDVVVEKLTEVMDRTDGASLIDSMVGHARALATGDPEAMEVAMRRFVAAGATLLAAEVASQWSSMLLASGDRQAAARVELTALHLWSGCPVARTAALIELPTILTRREFEVALDAGGGMSSPEISQARYISARTVDNHLGRLYRKLGVDGRDGVARLIESVRGVPSE